MGDRLNAEPVAIIRGAETIDMQEESSHGVLLLHGFGDTPQTLSLLAKRLAKSGYAVLAPLLPGHGRNVAVFSHSRAEEWIDSARESLEKMQRRYERVSLVGLSMGAALSVIIAAGASSIASVVLIAPYVGMPPLIRAAASTHWLWGRLAGEINARNSRSIRDHIEREKNLAYGATTGRALFQLLRVVRRARKALGDVRSPTLIILSREDPRVAPAVGEFALQRLGAVEKKLIWTEGAGHVITVDYGRERVFTQVVAWLNAHDSKRDSRRV
jgi:carboxylesterase